MPWIGACYSPSASPGAPCGVGDVCPSGLSCIGGRCEPPGSSDVDAATDDVDADVPDDGVTACGCTGTTLACGASETACPAGCSTNGTAHCLVFSPVNAGAFSSADGTQAITINAAYDVDVDTGAITLRAGSSPLRAAGTGIMDGIRYEQSGAYAIFSLTGLTLGAAGELRLTGTRPTILIVDGDVTIQGLVDLSGGCANGTPACAGPGGGEGGVAPGGSAAGCGAGAAGGDADGTNQVHAYGAGGGGFGTAGQQGAGTQGSAGAACGTASLTPLIGGSGGGHGGNVVSTNLSGGTGGGGGGALQITASGEITVGASGTIDAGGAGGQGDPGTTRGAGGGGSGGAILLQASSVTITGVVAANGGGGGGHNAAGPGEDGTRSATPAKGFGTSSLYKGGDGGAGSTAPAGAGTSHGGGGGGAAGRIRILGAQTDLGGGVISPTPVLGTP